MLEIIFTKKKITKKLSKSTRNLVVTLSICELLWVPLKTTRKVRILIYYVYQGFCLLDSFMYTVYNDVLNNDIDIELPSKLT